MLTPRNLGKIFSNLLECPGIRRGEGNRLGCLKLLTEWKLPLFWFKCLCQFSRLKTPDKTSPFGKMSWNKGKMQSKSMLGPQEQMTLGSAGRQLSWMFPPGPINSSDFGVCGWKGRKVGGMAGCLPSGSPTPGPCSACFIQDFRDPQNPGRGTVTSHKCQ